MSPPGAGGKLDRPCLYGDHDTIFVAPYVELRAGDQHACIARFDQERPGGIVADGKQSLATMQFDSAASIIKGNGDICVGIQINHPAARFAGAHLST